jgi:hypothetical protein
VNEEAHADDGCRATKERNLMSSSYRTVNTLAVGSGNLSFNSAWGNNLGLLRDSHETRKNILLERCRVFVMFNLVVHMVTSRL